LEDHGEIALLKSERLREFVSLLETGDEVEMEIGWDWVLDCWFGWKLALELSKLESEALSGLKNLKFSNEK
jgi:hypothetical protein